MNVNMASINNEYSHMSVIANQHTASQLDENNYDCVISTPTVPINKQMEMVRGDDEQQDRTNGEVVYHVLEPTDEYNFYEPSHGLERESEQFGERNYGKSDQPKPATRVVQDVYATPYSNTNTNPADKDKPPQKAPQVSDYKSASNIFPNNELQCGFTEDDTYNTLELTHINQSNVKSVENTEDVYDSLEHPKESSVQRSIHQSNCTPTEHLKVHLKEDTSNHGRYVELQHRKSKPVVLWIFKGLTILLLLAVIGMAYLFYHLNKELNNNTMDLRNNRIKIKDIDVSQKKTNMAVNSSFHALNKTLIVLGRKQQSHITNVSDTVRKQNAEISKVSDTVRKQNAEISNVNKTMSNLGRKQQSDITNVESKEISDIGNLTKGLNAIESRHLEDVKTIIKGMYAARAYEKAEISVRFSDLVVSREGGAYKISANIEVYDAGWYQVCGERFTKQAANVFCKMGGFTRGTLQHKDIKGRVVGKADTGSGYYYTLKCIGSEARLQDCKKDHNRSGCQTNISIVKCYTRRDLLR